MNSIDTKHENTPEHSSVDMDRLHSTLFRIGKCTAEILERHNIPYMLAYGTLLGAVRHRGFIPWDYDFDLLLFGDSYEDAMECLRKELPDDMFLEDWKSEPFFFHAWAHVRDLKSRALSSRYPHDNAYAHHGVKIDLYITRKVRRCDLMDYLNDENAAYIERRKQKGLITPEELSRRTASLQEARAAAAQEHSTDTHEVYALMTPYKCKYLEHDEIFPLKKYRFEDTEFYGPAKAEVILSKIYGEFMTFPPVEERMRAAPKVEFL